MDIDEISSHLTGLPIPQIQCFDVIGSTNDAALSWASEGAPDGCLVIADQQTQGRGRLGRSWITRPGSALAVSVILHPSPDEQEHISLFTALGALSISQALEEMLRLQPEIKWPNDILLGRRKAAGILAETAWLGEKLQALVIGMGINIKAEAVPPVNSLMFPATSIEENAGCTVERLSLLRAVLNALFAWRIRIAEKTFYEAWEQRLAFKGEWVQIEGAAQSFGAQPLIGLVKGLDEAGSLRLQTPSGETVLINTGDVHLRVVE